MDGIPPTAPGPYPGTPPGGPAWQDQFCPAPASAAAHPQVAQFPTAPLAPVAPQAPSRFAPLSALPPEKRLPAKRAPGILPSPTSAPVTPVPSIAPRQLPGVQDARAHQRPVAMKNISFNCPSCLAILTIKQPEQYDGQAAPCPNCGVVILPPRIAPVSPFTLLSAPGSGQAPSLMPPQRRIPAPNHPLAPPDSTKPELNPVTRQLAKAALF